MSESGPKAILQAASGLEEALQPWGGPIRPSRAVKTPSCGTRTSTLHSRSAPGASSVGDPGPPPKADVLPPHPGWAWSCQLAHVPARGKPRTVLPNAWRAKAFPSQPSFPSQSRQDSAGAFLWGKTPAGHCAISPNALPSRSLPFLRLSLPCGRWGDQPNCPLSAVLMAP